MIPDIQSSNRKRWGHSWISLQNFNLDVIRDIDITDDTIILTMEPGVEVLRKIHFITSSWPMLAFYEVHMITAEWNNVRFEDGLPIATYGITGDVILETFIKSYQEG